MTPTPCPICKKPAAPDTKPFCSKRCKDVDLGRWFSESYVIPTDEPPNSNDNDQTS